MNKKEFKKKYDICDYKKAKKNSELLGKFNMESLNNNYVKILLNLYKNDDNYYINEIELIIEPFNINSSSDDDDDNEINKELKNYLENKIRDDIDDYSLFYKLKGKIIYILITIRQYIINIFSFYKKDFYLNFGIHYKIKDDSYDIISFGSDKYIKYEEILDIFYNDKKSDKIKKEELYSIGIINRIRSYINYENIINVNGWLYKNKPIEELCENIFNSYKKTYCLLCYKKVDNDGFTCKNCKNKSEKLKEIFNICKNKEIIKLLLYSFDCHCENNKVTSILKGINDIINENKWICEMNIEKLLYYKNPIYIMNLLIRITNDCNFKRLEKTEYAQIKNAHIIKLINKEDVINDYNNEKIDGEEKIKFLEINKNNIYQFLYSKNYGKNGHYKAYKNIRGSFNKKDEFKYIYK